MNHIINNNRHLQENGKGPVAVEVIGESGIGKTSSIVQLADELNLNFVKLNLAQIEEIGDLVGFPIRQFEVTDGATVKYVDESALEDVRTEGYKTTGKNRMSYCPRIMANEVAESKKEAPGTVVMVCFPALIRSASSSPSKGKGPIPKMPFSD